MHVGGWANVRLWTSPWTSGWVATTRSATPRRDGKSLQGPAGRTEAQVAFGSRLQADQAVRDEGAVLHAVVEHHSLEFWSGLGHGAQGFEAVGPDGDWDGAKRPGHHPRFIPDVFPRACLVHPLKLLGGTSVSAGKDGDGAGPESRFEPLGQIHGVRGFPRAAQLEVAHDQRGQSAAFAVQEAPVVRLCAAAKARRHRAPPAGRTTGPAKRVLGASGATRTRWRRPRGTALESVPSAAWTRP